MAGARCRQPSGDGLLGEIRALGKLQVWLAMC